MRTCISIDNHTWFQLAYCYLHVVMCCDLSTENYGQAKLFSYVFLATGLVPSRHRPFPPVARLFYIYLDTELLIIAHAIKQACMVGNGSLRHRRYCLSIYTRSCTWYTNIKRVRVLKLTYLRDPLHSRHVWLHSMLRRCHFGYIRS